MNVAAIVAGLWPAFRKIITDIGRWLVGRIRRHGAKKLAAYMELRIDVFEDRLARARRPHRQKWLRGRIRRWNNAIVWLEANAAKFNKSVADAIEKLAIADRIPMRAPLERAA